LIITKHTTKSLHSGEKAELLLTPFAGNGKTSYRWVNLAYRRGKPSYKRPNLASESPNLALGSPKPPLGGVKACRGHASQGVYAAT